MVANTFGFTQVDMGDHELAAFLRKHGAIDNFQRTSDGVMWYTPEDVCAAVCFYDNAEPSYRCFINNSLVR